MADSDDAKRARTSSKRRFTLSKNSLMSAVEQGTSLVTVRSRYEKFKEAWIQVQAAYEDYLEVVGDNEADVRWIDDVSEEFDKIEILVDNHIENAESATEWKGRKETVDAEKALNEQRMQMIRLRETESYMTSRFQRGLKLKKICDDVTELMNTVDDHIHTSAAVKSMFKSLKEAMDSCCDAHEKYLNSIEDKETKESEETKWIIDIMDIYNKVSTKCHIFISKNEKTEESAVQGGRGTSAGFQLEKLRFDVFEGDIRKYPRFKEQFLSFIKPRYRPEEEAFVLRSYLIPSIKEDVEGVGEDAKEIWKRLDRKYGDEYKLVDTIMAEIKGLEANNGQPEQVLRMIATIEKAHRDLIYLKKENEMNNAVIISMIEEKMSDGVKQEWVRLVNGEKREEIRKEKFKYLLKFLLEVKDRIEYEYADLRLSESMKHMSMNVQERSARGLCWIHPSQRDHPIWRCKDFLSKTPDERWVAVRENEACFSCLQKGHLSKSCQQNYKCRKENCQQANHYLLHTGCVTSGISCHSNQQGQEVILQLQTLRMKNENGKVIDANVMWDGGSTLSFITFQLAERMNLKRKRECIQIIKIGGEVENLDTYRYNFEIVGNDGTVFNVDALGISKISTGIMRIDLTDINTVLNLRPNEVKRPETGEIEVLMGFDYASLHPVRIQAVGNLLLLENPFGKIIGGVKEGIVEGTKVLHCAHVQQLSANVADFYFFEQLGVESHPKCGSCRCGKCNLGGKNMTIQEEQEYNLIEENMIYKKDEQRWEAAYPWKRDANLLPNNRHIVVGALKRTERRLKKNEEYGKLYQQQIDDMIQRGVCRKLSSDELQNYDGPIYYIAHHEVLKPDSKSTPMRIVFNSSAKYKGHVLNEYYAQGPNLLNSLLGVLLRFRERSIAVIGDIRKMYHSIDIPLKDQMTHLFVWRNLDENKEIDTYAIKVVNFGDRPSAAIALIALRKTAEEGKEGSEEASNIIQKNSYMDDIITSVDSKEESMKLTKDIDNILSKGGFQIKKWVIAGEGSCNKEKEKVEAQTVCYFADQSNERVLGMDWDAEKDEFFFKSKVNFSEKRRKVRTSPDLKEDQILSCVPETLTKRKILAQVNRIYDPLGLLAPFTVRAKILLRKLYACDKDYGWDDKVPEILRNEWIKFFQQLFDIEKIRFQRCIKPKEAVGHPELVLFSDGSSEAYGAVAYIRWKISEDHYHYQLLASKNRIAPIKIMDVVKLELSAAVLSKRLRVFIEEEMSFHFHKVYHIVDSEIVKAMINKGSYGFGTFIANRIGEIQEKTMANEWYWSAGKNNIADWLTRGRMPQELDATSCWQKGPEFLQQKFEKWPVSSKSDVKDLPGRTNSSVAKVERVETLAQRIDVERFSKFLLLICTTARILKLYRKYKEGNRNLVSMNVMKSEDIERAERFWVKDAQISLHEKLRKGKLHRLCARIEDGVIVVGGRTEQWMKATWNRQNFILLPYKHRLSWLIMAFEHKKIGHLGVSSTVSAVRKKYWITYAHKLAKSIRAKCTDCKKRDKMLENQVMSDLPQERMNPCPPFTNVGCDYFGPFIIRGEVQKRVRGKCFGMIFTCLSSRSVYIDVTQDYSTDSFMQVMRRFASIRGWPKKIHSDRGSQLVAASKELKDAVRGIDEKELLALNNKGTDWTFSSPNAPWMNGATEALVKTAKRSLCMAIGEQVLKYSELQTVLFECAQLMNQRPIGRHPTNPDEGSYLCPNDLLLGRASPSIPQGPFKEATPKKRFLFIQSVAKSFWKKWYRDVFPSMVIRSKWHTERRDVKVGDVVVVYDANVVRGQWRMGLVTKSIPSHDGRVRRVMVRLANLSQDDGKGRIIEVERAVARLIVLLPTDATN